MSWLFLSVEAVRTIHDDLIDVYGGSHGLRDAGLLESAVLRAENRAAYDPEATTATIAASLSFGSSRTTRLLTATKESGLRCWSTFSA